MDSNRYYNFGTVREIPANAAESRIIPFVLSTPTRDRHNTVLNQSNWSLDNYLRNPIVAYQHNVFGDFCNPADPDNIIGKTVEIGIENDALVAAAEFEGAELNAKAEKIFRKILFGSIGATSVGFQEIGQGRYGEGEEARDGANETYYFGGQELLEWSIVNIPSNPDAGKRKMGSMRDHVAAAIGYAYRQLGGQMRLSQIEEMRVRDILDLLEGRDLGIKTTDPDKARRMIEQARADARLRLLKLHSHKG